MAEPNPRISVDFLKNKYPVLCDKLDDDDLREIVQLLGKEMIWTKAALQLVSREELEKKDFPSFALAVLNTKR